MKKIITILVLSFAFTFQAQNFSGKAVYKTNSKSGIKIGKNSKMTDKQREQMEAKLRKMNQKTYHLEFNQHESTYKQEAKLNAPSVPSAKGGIMVMSFGSGDNSILYKNTKKNTFSEKKELMGKIFLVKDALEKYDWEMTTETKNIGNYTCYKATYTKEVEDIKMSFINGESKEEKSMKTVTTTAWYTPQIPIANGPGKYQGLPGLILEVNDGRTTIVCSEIELSTNEEREIEAPKKGKVVSQEKFTKISKQKTKEMMEQFKSRKGGSFGGINIKMN